MCSAGGLPAAAGNIGRCCVCERVGVDRFWVVPSRLNEKRCFTVRSVTMVADTAAAATAASAAEAVAAAAAANRAFRGISFEYSAPQRQLAPIIRQRIKIVAW